MTVFFSEGREKTHSNDILSTEANAGRRRRCVIVWAKCWGFSWFLFWIFSRTKAQSTRGMEELEGCETYLIKPGQIGRTLLLHHETPEHDDTVCSSCPEWSRIVDEKHRADMVLRRWRSPQCLQRVTPHCAGLTRMLCNSRVGTLFGAGKPSTTLCKEENPQKRISNLHHQRKQIDNQFHDARICAILRGFPSNRKTRNTQSTHNLSSVCCWPRRYSSLKSGARTDSNPVEATKT